MFCAGNNFERSFPSIFLRIPLIQEPNRAFAFWSFIPSEEAVCKAIQLAYSSNCFAQRFSQKAEWMTSVHPKFLSFSTHIFCFSTWPSEQFLQLGHSSEGGRQHQSCVYYLAAILDSQLWSCKSYFLDYFRAHSLFGIDTTRASEIYLPLVLFVEHCISF